MESKGSLASSRATSVKALLSRSFNYLSIFGVVAIVLFSSELSAYSAQATLVWDAVNDPGVVGYKLHYGKVPGLYTNSVDTGITTSSTVSDLSEGETYYFASTAYDSTGNQSGYSNEVSKSIPSSTRYSLVVAQIGSGAGTMAGSGISCGSVCSNDYAPGTVVTLTATPAIGSIFAGWSGGGCSGTGTCTVTMNASTSITATFNSSAVTYDITATSLGSGTIMALNNPNVSLGTSGTTTVSIVNVTKGDNQQFSITPNTGYKVSDVKVDGTSIGAVSSYIFSNITSNHTISATFVTTTNTSSYTINASAGTGGTISPAGTVTVSGGSSKSFTITPSNRRYRISDVMVNGVSKGAISLFTFSSISANNTIHATFSKINKE